MKHFTFLIISFLFISFNLKGQHYFNVGLDNMYLNDEYRIYFPSNMPISQPINYYTDFNEKYLFSGIEIGYHFNSKKNIYFRLNTSLYWKLYAKDKVESFSSLIHANKLKIQSGKQISIKKHSLGLGGEFYIFSSKTLNGDYGIGPIIDYSIPLKDNKNLRFYGSYAFDLNHICLRCDESLPRSFAYHFGILLDMNFANKTE